MPALRANRRQSQKHGIVTTSTIITIVAVVTIVTIIPVVTMINETFLQVSVVIVLMDYYYY